MQSQVFDHINPTYYPGGNGVVSFLVTGHAGIGYGIPMILHRLTIRCHHHLDNM